MTLKRISWFWLSDHGASKLASLLIFMASRHACKITVANKRGIITAEFTLAKCESCLTEIAGLDCFFAHLYLYVQLHSIVCHRKNTSAWSVLFFYESKSRLSERGFVTEESPAFKTMASSPNSKSAVKWQLQQLRILTDAQTSFGCGISTRMTRESDDIQKLQLITMDEKEQYYNVLCTHQRNIFEPYSLSVVCCGIVYECGLNIVIILSENYPRLFCIHQEQIYLLNVNEYAGPHEFWLCGKRNSQDCKRNASMLPIFTIQEFMSHCRFCMAQVSSGIALLGAQYTIKYGSGYHKERTKFYFLH